jgi:hypothetical protein
MRQMTDARSVEIRAVENANSIDGVTPPDHGKMLPMPEGNSFVWAAVNLAFAWGAGAIIGSGSALWILRTVLSERLKAAIKAEYDEKLETHKAQLKAQSDIAIERLRSSLAMAANERHLVFSKLHEKRLEVIAEVYASLHAFIGALGNYAVSLGPMAQKGPSQSERGQKAAEIGYGFAALYGEKQIFIPKPTAKKLDQIREAATLLYYQFFFNVDATPQISGEVARQWREVVLKLEDLSKRAMVDLQDNFRSLLGSTLPDGR